MGLINDHDFGILKPWILKGTQGILEKVEYIHLERFFGDALPEKKNHLCIHTHITYYYYTHFPWTMTEMAFWVQQNEKTYGENRQIMTDKHHRGWVSRFRTSSNGSIVFFGGIIP